MNPDRTCAMLSSMTKYFGLSQIEIRHRPLARRQDERAYGQR